jgi:hypothetical protein
MVVVGFGGPQKWAKDRGVKFEFGRIPKKSNSPKEEFEFGFIRMVVVGFRGL